MVTRASMRLAVVVACRYLLSIMHIVPWLSGGVGMSCEHSDIEYDRAIDRNVAGQSTVWWAPRAHADAGVVLAQSGPRMMIIVGVSNDHSKRFDYRPMRHQISQQWAAFRVGTGCPPYD